MITRRRNIFPIVMLLVMVVCTLSSCHKKADPEHVHEACPIVLSADVEWPSDVKSGVIGGVSDLAGDGFVVWATFGQSSSSSVRNDVFGHGGTKAYHPDWTYSPQRFWYQGSYLFASALPASAFNAEYAMHGDSNVSNGINGSLGTDGTLSLTDFNLKASQADLMVAFDMVDNSSDTRTESDKVSLQFEHQLSMINFKANYDPNSQSVIQIDQLTLYGNSSTASVTFTYDDRGTSGEVDDRILSDWTLGGVTTASDPYRRVTRPSGESWTASGQLLMKDVLVFPEECEFTLVVDYTESYGGASAQARQSAAIDVDWDAGKVYTYDFTLSSKNIIFSAPTVTPWVSGGAADDIPSM